MLNFLWGSFVADDESSNFANFSRQLLQLTGVNLGWCQTVQPVTEPKI
jgi:hypothetical protein